MKLNNENKFYSDILWIFWHVSKTIVLYLTVYPDIIGTKTQRHKENIKSILKTWCISGKLIHSKLLGTK